jgi:hypothetical protein
MSELVVYVSNCLIDGEEVTTNFDGSRTRDIITLNINGWQVLLRQAPERHAQNFKGKFVAVTSLHFPDTEEGEIPLLLELSDRLCEILSFATESRVLVYGHDYPEVGTLQQRHSVIGTVGAFRPPFDPFDGAAIKHFIEKCFTPYLQNRDLRCLHVVFDYLYHAGINGLAIEVKLASLFILLENLKYTYAHQAVYPFINGFFRQIGATTASPGSKVSFETLITKMLSVFGMNRDMAQIVRLRNELIHSGLIAIDVNDRLALFEEIQDIIREYILRLLRFQGEYFCYTSKQARKIT